jgi:hypothetical protein
MEGLDRQVIEALTSGRKLKSRTERFAIVRDGAGTGVNKVPAADIKPEGFGYFDSKVGTMRRSRKGRTYHAPNGYSRYAGQYETPEVIAYLA